MLCYLNRGLILEQAICFLIREYFDNLHLEEKYKNFHIAVTTEHPFVKLYMQEGLNTSDSFPCVVVTTQEDRKPFEFSDLAPHLEAIGITDRDLNIITKTTEEYINKKGQVKTREIAGLCTVVDDSTLNAIIETIKNQGYCYGFSIRTRRKDSISVEIWAENIQLKNEIYEQLRLFITGNLRFLLSEKYSFFDIAIFDGTETGHRSNNFNMDFDIALAGSHITFDVNYCVEQIVLNTELTGVSPEIITEALNYGKE